MTRTARSTPRSLYRLPGTALLVLALLWAQLLGLAHGVRHTGAASGQAQVVAVQTAAAPDLLAHLLAPSGDERECRLYDQLGHGAPLQLQLPSLPAVLPPVLQVWALLPALWPQPCAAFAARAPPLSR